MCWLSVAQRTMLLHTANFGSRSVWNDPHAKANFIRIAFSKHFLMMFESEHWDARTVKEWCKWHCFPVRWYHALTVMKFTVGTANPMHIYIYLEYIYIYIFTYLFIYYLFICLLIYMIYSYIYIRLRESAEILSWQRQGSLPRGQKKTCDMCELCWDCSKLSDQGKASRLACSCRVKWWSWFSLTGSIWIYFKMLR